MNVVWDAHSDAEDRFIAIGRIARGLVLVVWTAKRKLVNASMGGTT